MALPLPVNGVFRVHPDPGSNALADFCRGPSMVPAAHAPTTADAPARAGNRQSRGWSSRHARRVILERVMDSFAPAQECARIRPGIRLRHPASRPRTRAHGSMSGHNAPGTLRADTGLRTQDSGLRTKDKGQDRTGQDRKKADTPAHGFGTSNEAGAAHPAGQPTQTGQTAVPHQQPRSRYGCSPVWATITPFPVCVSPQRPAHAPAAPFAPVGHACRAHALSFHALP